MAIGLFNQAARDRIRGSVHWTESQLGSQLQPQGPRPTNGPPGSGGVLPVVVRQAFQDAQTLTVSEVIESGEGIAISEDISLMWTWYNLRGRHYTPFIQAVGTLVVPRTNILQAVKVNNKWRVMQTTRLNFALQEQRFQVAGCLPIVR